MIRPGLCSVTYRDLPVEEVIALARDAGLEAIEWGADVHAPAHDLATVTRLGELTRAAGLAVASYGTYLRFDAEEDNICRAEVRKALEAARALGAPRLRVWAGSAGSVESSPEQRARVTTRLREAVQMAAEYGLEIGLEHHRGTLTDCLGSSLALLHAEGMEGLRTYWQPNVGQGDQQALADLEALLPQVSTVHVFAWWPTIERLPLAERAELWRGVFAVLARSGRDHDALLEFVPGDDPRLLAQEARTLRELIRAGEGAPEKPRALLAMQPNLPALLWTADLRAQLTTHLDVDPNRVVTSYAEVPEAELADVEVLITGWGAPLLDAATRARMPRLRAILHSGGTVRFLATPEVLTSEELRLTSTAEANAVPVAEYTLAQILLAGKRSLRCEADHRRLRGQPGAQRLDEGGNHGARIGLIGASRIGKLVAEQLRRFDLEVWIADPYITAQDAAELGARHVDLPEMFQHCDVVSIHAPDLPSTQGMVSADLLAAMPDGATLINTARPALVDLDALGREVCSGRIAAVLDVHDDLAADDPIWDAPYVSITPHIAGSLGNELHRLGGCVVDEARRYVSEQPALYPVDRERLGITA